MKHKTILALMAAGIAIVVPAPAVLLHRYSFDGPPGSTTITDSVGNANGTLINGSATATLTGSGQLNLDGNVSKAYVLLPGGLLNPLTNAVFETWVQNNDPNSDWAELWTFGTNNGVQGIHFLSLVPNNPVTGTIRLDTSGTLVLAPEPLPYTNMVCLTVSYNLTAQTASIYLGGQKVASGTETLPLYSIPDSDNYLGQSQFYGSGDPYVNGVLDEFRIYSGTESDLQIAIDAAAGPDNIVTNPGTLNSIQFNNSTNVLVKGEFLPSVLANYSLLNNVNISTVSGVTYSSDNTNVLAYETDGYFHAVGVGTTTIRASYQSLAAALTVTVTVMPWQPKQVPLMTDWAQQVDPTNVLPEYPRPQMVRSNWMNLNGVWQFQPGATNDPVPAGQNLAGVILVPFPMESALSGVMQYSAFSWYRRTFTVPEEWLGQRIILHFGAVNWRSQIYVNGQSVGTHTGGYDPFSYDITPYLNGGTNELIVRVYSPEDSGGEPRGKQTLYPGGIMFTSSSGIWQPVWLEPVPTTSISSLHLVPDIDNNRVLVTVGLSGPTNGLRVNGVAFAGSNLVTSTTVLPGNNLYLNIPSPILWSPTNPYLYNLQITLTSNSVPVDSITSYFGMRKISLGMNNGFVQILLNNQFTFEFGPLEQGFWPEGLYTAPTDQALQYDLRMEKTLGFNMVRKHLKVEPQRWYYWADQLGILVWQDMPSCNSYTTNSSPPPVNPLDFIAELTAMVTNHWNSPAIIMWDIFNEAQGEAGSANGVGQTNTAYLVSLVKTLDPSRLVNQASGWNWVGAGDVEDTHNYPDPECSVSPSQAVVCGEFGGIWLGITNHTWSPSDVPPYDVPPSQAANFVTPQFESLAGEVPGLIQTNGMSAAAYTEINDTEQELAGLETYDRKVLKPALLPMQTTITSLTGAPRPTNILPTPILAAISNVTITAGQTLLVTNIVNATAVPAQTMTWSLFTSPAGATINPTNGLITWRPTISQSPSTNLFTVVVIDSAWPPRSATQNFSVVVLSPVAPVFSSITMGTGGFQSAISGSAGPDYSIYATTNLSSGWQLLLVTNPVALPFLFTDPASANFQQRFYQVHLGP